MNIDNFNKWLNEENSDAESEAIERALMADLKEHRLKEQFKERLKTQRERRERIKFGLITLGLVVAIGSLIYFVSRLKKTPLPIHSPIEKVGQTDKPIVAEQPLQQNLRANKSVVFAPKNNETIAMDSLLSNNAVVIQKPMPVKTVELPPSKGILSAQYLRTLRPPVDTEYLYVSHAEKRPVYFYTSTEDERDTFTTLDLSKEKLTDIPPKVFPYTQLKTLLLNNNLLKTLDIRIAELSHLEQLNLAKNKLVGLPKALTELSNLVSLNLENNKLTSLPVDIGQMLKLKTLDAHSNKLTALPLSIGQLSSLTDLISSSVFGRVLTQTH